MKKLLLITIIAFLYVSIIGCVSSFKTSYKCLNREQIDMIKNSSDRIITCEEPSLRPLPSVDAPVLSKTLFEEGYIYIGKSYFNDTNTDGQKDAFDFGKELGACVVIYGKAYTGEQAGVMAKKIMFTNRRVLLAVNTPYTV